VNAQESPGRERLHTYLNDHLAGSVAAIELLDDVIEHHSEIGSERSFATGAVTFSPIRRRWQFDSKLGAEESAIRKAGAWVAEKFSRIKVGDLDDSAGLLQGAGGIGFGNYRQAASLALIGGDHAEFCGAAKERISASFEKRAQEQFERVETLRLEMAREAFRA